MNTQTQTPNISHFDLVATTAHELKTPLNLIAGLSSMLKSGQFGAASAQQKRYLTKIEYSSDRLLRLAEGLICAVRAPENAIKFKVEPVSIKPLLGQITNELETYASQRNQKIIIRIVHSLPLVVADREHVYQIMFNLIDNALSYSPDNSTIKVEGSVSGSSLKLSVQNPGNAITAKEYGEIFKRFGHSQQPLQTYPGSSGLGLYIAKTLTELHKGTLRPKRAKGGMAFVVRLPTVQQLSLF